MKKYLFGMLAIAMAVGFSAFTTAKKTSSLTTTTFYFDGALDDELDVENKAKWFDEEALPSSCDPGEEFACSIVVEDQYTEEGEGGIRTLKSDVIIVAQLVGELYRVASSSTNISQIVNGEE
jgi:hypothetical protein